MQILTYWARRTEQKFASVPNLRWIGNTLLLVKPLPPDEFELGHRASFARPDPNWHWQQTLKFEKDQSWFAAAFHCDSVLKSRPDNAAAKALPEKARGELKKP